EKYDALTSYATGGVEEEDVFRLVGCGRGGMGVQLSEDPRSGNVIVMGTTMGGPAALVGVRDWPGALSKSIPRGAGGDRNDHNEDDDATTILHLTLTSARIDSSINQVESSTFVSAGGKRIGLLRVPSFSTETAGQMVDGLRYVTTIDGGGGDGAIDAIAIDVRGNVGGYMPAGVDVARLCLPAGDRIISEVGRPTVGGGSSSSSSSSSVTKIYDADGIGARTSVPLYVLVDHRTASASEIFASALHDNGRAVIVGTTSTFGKGRIQTMRPLGNGCGVAITRARYVTPSGRDLQGVGIKPDRVPAKCGVEDTARTCLKGIV
ncbi:hypothetical protein ACHAXA_004944, partial [Cyclostephanos tholiformis]